MIDLRQIYQETIGDDMIALHHSQYLKEDSYPAVKVAARGCADFY